MKEVKIYIINVSKQGWPLRPALMVYFLLLGLLHFSFFLRLCLLYSTPKGLSAMSSRSVLDGLTPSPSFDELT